MSGNIHSLEFYKLMALRYADTLKGCGNNNGKIDTDEEQTIFNYYMAQFERDNQKDITEKDIALHTDEIVYTEEEKAAMKILYVLNNRLFNSKLSDTEKYILDRAEDIHDRMLGGRDEETGEIRENKIFNVDRFQSNAQSTIEYLRNLNDKGLLEELELDGEKLNLNIDAINAYERALNEEYNLNIDG